MYKYLSLLFIVAFFTMCQNAEQSVFHEDAEMKEDVAIRAQSAVTPPPPPSPQSPEMENTNQTRTRKIIRTGNVSLKTDNLKETLSYLNALITKNNCYLASENLQDDDYRIVANYTVRVPVQSFDTFLQGVEKGKAKITDKSVYSEDVTKQFIDLEIRLDNKEKYVKRYQELLKKANSIKEILEIEGQIRVLEEEIDSTKGQLRYLSNQVSFSTLQISIIQEKEYVYTPEKRDSFWQRLKSSFVEGWYAFTEFILFAVKLWFLWIILIAIVVIFRKYLKRKKQKRQKTF